MDTNLLKIFIAVANNRSVTLAAQELGYAQSNVTTRIKQLEKTLGISLFHRKPQGVCLNKEGEKFFIHAIEIINRLEQAVADMQECEGQTKLIIGSTESNATVRATPFLVGLHQAFPNMQLALITGTTEQISQMLVDYKVDIAFLTGHVNNSSFELLNAVDEEVVLVESKSPINDNTYIAFKKGCTYHELTSDYIRHLNLDNYKVLEFGSFETVLGCVEAGLGKALLPISIIKKLSQLDKFNIKKIDVKFSNIQTTLMCRVNNQPKIITYLKGVNIGLTISK